MIKYHPTVKTTTKIRKEIHDNFVIFQKFVYNIKY